ncbi:hypothetical protein [Leptospira ellinghausenii]
MKERFKNHPERHKGIQWNLIEEKLKNHPVGLKHQRRSEN